jgi:hypothetical protein
MQAEAMPLVQTLNLTEEEEPSMYAVFFPPPHLVNCLPYNLMAQVNSSTGR